MLNRIAIIIFSLLTALFSIAAGQDSIGQSFNSNGIASEAKPLSLDEAIDIALKKNVLLRASRHAVSSADWGVKKAYLDFLPRVDFDLQYRRLDGATVDRANAFFDLVNDPDGPYTNPDSPLFIPEEFRKEFRPGAYRDSFAPSFTLMQPVYNGGLLHSQLGLARAQEHRSEAELEDMRQQVILRTQAAYYEVLKAQELLVLAIETDDSNREHLRSAEKMLDVGMRSRSDVLRFEVQKASSESEVVVAENRYEIAQLELNNVLGVGLNEAYKLQPIDRQDWTHPTELTEQISIALREHPGLRIVRSSIDLQNSAVGIARSDFLPKINLAYNYSWENNNTIEFDSFSQWSFAVTASVPIFNSFQNYANLQKEKQSLQETKEFEDDFKRNLVVQVKQASLNLKAAKKRIKIATKAVEEAEENLRIIKKSYNVGLVSSLDVIDTQVATTQAKANLIESRYDLFLAQAQLSRALGILGESDSSSSR